jgi:hypothetical protein
LSVAAVQPSVRLVVVVETALTPVGCAGGVVSPQASVETITVVLPDELPAVSNASTASV